MKIEINTQEGLDLLKHYPQGTTVVEYVNLLIKGKLDKYKPRPDPVEEILNQYISLCDAEAAIDDPDLIKLSIKLDNHFGHDSGDRTQVSWIPIVKNSFEYTIRDEESEIVYNSDKYSVVVSPNFDWNGYIYVKENS